MTVQELKKIITTDKKRFRKDDKFYFGRSYLLGEEEKEIPCDLGVSIPFIMPAKLLKQILTVCEKKSEIHAWMSREKKVKDKEYTLYLNLEIDQAKFALRVQSAYESEIPITEQEAPQKHPHTPTQDHARDLTLQVDGRTFKRVSNYYYVYYKDLESLTGQTGIKQRYGGKFVKVTPEMIFDTTFLYKKTGFDNLTGKRLDRGLPPRLTRQRFLHQEKASPRFREIRG